MNTSIHHRIKMLIEETNDAFASCDTGMNADYAEFATLALSEFKHVLSNPALTRRELMGVLRSGMAKHKVVDPESCWATFMAYYIAKTSNNDLRQSPQSFQRHDDKVESEQEAVA